MNVHILSFLKAFSLVSLAEHNLHFLDTKHNRSFPYVTLTEVGGWRTEQLKSYKDLKSYIFVVINSISFDVGEEMQICIQVNMPPSMLICLFSFAEQKTSIYKECLSVRKLLSHTITCHLHPGRINLRKTRTLSNYTLLQSSPPS